MQKESKLFSKDVACKQAHIVASKLFLIRAHKEVWASLNI